MKRKVFLLTIMILIFNCFSIFATNTNDWVLDEPNVISEETANYIKNLNENVFTNYKNKPQLAIMIINKLPDGYTMDQYKLETFNKYGVGTKEENCGMLFIFSLTDRKYGFEIGDGYKNGTLLRKDLSTDFINSNMISLLQNEQYDSVIMQIVQHIENIMQDEENGVYLQKEKMAKEQELQRQENTKKLFMWIMIIAFPCGIIYILLILYKNLTLSKRIKDILNSYQKQMNLLQKDDFIIFKELKSILKHKYKEDIKPVILDYIYRIYKEENKNKLLRKIENEVNLNLSNSEHNLYISNLYKINNYDNFLNLNLESLDSIIDTTNYQIKKRREIYNQNLEKINSYIKDNMSKIDLEKVSLTTLENNMKKFANSDYILSNDEIFKIFNEELKSSEFDYDFNCFLKEHNSEINSRYFNKSNFYKNLKNSNEYRNYSSRNKNNDWMLLLLYSHLKQNETRIKYEEAEQARRERQRRQEESNHYDSFGSSFGGGSSSGGGFSGGW